MMNKPTVKINHFDFSCEADSYNEAVKIFAKGNDIGIKTAFTLCTSKHVIIEHFDHNQEQETRA